MSSPTQSSSNAGKIATIGLLVAIVGVVIAGLALPGQLGWLRNLIGGGGEAKPCEAACSSQLKVTCSLPEGAKPGANLDITYVITSSIATTVGIGTGVYDDNGTDRSDGSGDQASYSLKPGENSVPITIVPPKNLRAGHYEVTAELWPPNKIGDGETFTDSSCGSFTVSK